MSRLIDADALIEAFKVKSGIWTETSKYLIKVIEKQPTAYNVDAVVEELEKESDFFGGKPMGSLQKAYYCKGIDKAIDIVRKGGAT